MKVYLDENATKHIDEIKAFLEHEALHNVNMNGVEFDVVENDSFTHIECDESADAVMLLAEINHIAGV